MAASRKLFTKSEASNGVEESVDLTDNININAAVALNPGGLAPQSPAEMPGGVELQLVNSDSNNNAVTAPYGTWNLMMDQSLERQQALLAVTEEDEKEEQTELVELTISWPLLSPPVIFQLKYKLIPVLVYFSETTLLSWLLQPRWVHNFTILAFCNFPPTFFIGSWF